MPDNFVPIEIVYNLYVRACRNAENLPSFCSGTAKSQLRPLVTFSSTHRKYTKIW